MTWHASCKRTQQHTEVVLGSIIKSLQKLQMILLLLMSRVDRLLGASAL